MGDDGDENEYDEPMMVVESLVIWVNDISKVCSGILHLPVQLDWFRINVFHRGHDMMHRSVLIIYDHQFFIAWSPLIMHDMMHRSAVVIYDQQCFIVTITTFMHEQ